MNTMGSLTRAGVCVRTVDSPRWAAVASGDIRVGGFPVRFVREYDLLRLRGGWVASYVDGEGAVKPGQGHMQICIQSGSPTVSTASLFLCGFLAVLAVTGRTQADPWARSSIHLSSNAPQAPAPSSS